MNSTIFAFGMPGPMELVVILAIVLIFFGVGRLPSVLGEMGKGIKAFKEGMKEDDEPRKEIDVTEAPRQKSYEADEIRVEKK